MKKRYMNPEMETVNIRPVVLQSASNPDVTADPNASSIEAGSVEAPSFFGGGDSEDW